MSTPSNLQPKHPYVGQRLPFEGESDHIENSSQYPAIIFGTFDPEIFSSRINNYKNSVVKGYVRNLNDSEEGSDIHATTTNPSLIVTIIKVKNCLDERITIFLKSDKRHSVLPKRCISEEKRLAPKQIFEYHILRNVNFKLIIKTDDPQINSKKIHIKAKGDQFFSFRIQETGDVEQSDDVEPFDDCCTIL